MAYLGRFKEEVSGANVSDISTLQIVPEIEVILSGIEANTL